MSKGVMRKYVDQESTEIVNDYINSLCADQNFLCSNRKICSESSTYFGNLSNIDKICNEIKKSNKCTDDIDICVVKADNLLTTSKKDVNTTFMNIIVPITGASDKYGNQMFLRLPPLSGSKIPGEDNLCNSCACFERFSVAPGTSAGIDSQYTAPGQGECIFNSNFEYYYYPLDVENITRALNNKSGIMIGNYKVLPDNIIYANNSEDLTVNNLYDILITNGINNNIAFNFITKKLWPNNIDKELELKLHIKNKKGLLQLESNKQEFKNDLITFYVIFIAFIILIIFNLNIV